MIEVSAGRSGSEVTITMQGHSGYAEAGKDIVCAAASMLFFLACERAEALCEDVQVSKRSGFGELRCRPGDMEAVTALETVLSGFAMLAAGCPEYVKMTGETEICPF